VPPTKASEAGLRGTGSGSGVAAPLRCPAGAHCGSGTAQGRSPLTLKQPLLTFEARSRRGKNVS